MTKSHIHYSKTKYKGGEEAEGLQAPWNISMAPRAKKAYLALEIFLPVRSMRQGYAFVSVYVCVCVCVCICVVKKHACLRLTVRNSPQKRTLLPVY